MAMMARHRSVRRTAAAAFLLSVIVLAVGFANLVVAWERAGGSILSNGETIAVTTSARERSHVFGSLVEATLTVFVDRDAIDPQSVQVDVNFHPYRLFSQPIRSETSLGRITILRYVYLLSCIDDVACLPWGEETVWRRALISYLPWGAKEASVTSVPWPIVATSTQLSKNDLLFRRFRIGPSELPPLSYRFGIAPEMIEAIFLLLAFVGVVSGVRCFLMTFRRRGEVISGEENVVALSSLEAAALRVARAFKGADEREQRLALDHFSRELQAEGFLKLASRACELAWRSATVPDLQAIRALLRAFASEKVGEER